MKKLTMALVAVFVAGGVSEAAAQTATGQASVTIPQVLMIRSVGDLTIGAGAFDFSATNEATGTGSVAVETRANVQHAVEVTGADLNRVGGGSIGLEVQAGSGWESVGAAAVKALSSLAAGSPSGTVNFRATANVATHAPGEYTGTITYTVVADN